MGLSDRFIIVQVCRLGLGTRPGSPQVYNFSVAEQNWHSVSEAQGEELLRETISSGFYNTSSVLKGFASLIYEH